MAKASTKKFGWNGMMSSGGRLHLSLYFENPEEITEDDVLGAAAQSISDGAKTMEQQGYIPLSARLMSSREIADEYGFTRQYWEKLLREGKLPYYQTAAGRITIDLWITGYLQNKEKVDEYARNLKKIVNVIKDLRREKRHPQHITCPNCSEETLRYSDNKAELNGLCDAHCGFEFTVAV